MLPASREGAVVGTAPGRSLVPPVSAVVREDGPERTWTETRVRSLALRVSDNLSRSQTKPAIFPAPFFIPLWDFLSLLIGRLRTSASSPQSFLCLETRMPR